MGTESMAELVTSSTPVAVTFMITVVVMKVTAFVLGYLIVRLGHDTLLRGITGDMEFDFGGHGLNAKLRSASPGAFFVLMGSAIIVWGLWVSKPMSLKGSSTPATPIVEAAADTSGMRRIPLPD